MKYGNHSKWKRFASSPITLLLSFILFAFMLDGVVGMYQKSRLSLKKADEARAKLVEMRNRKDQLSQVVEYLSTDEGIEAEMRNKFRAVKEGESVAVIIEKQDGSGRGASVTSATSTSDRKRKSFWSFLGF